MKQRAMPVVMYRAKTKNRRILILFSEPVDDGEPFFIVSTKRLVNFKDRTITKTETAYTIETFTLLKDLFADISDFPIVAKKINPFLGFDKCDLKIHTNK